MPQAALSEIRRSFGVAVIQGPRALRADAHLVYEAHRVVRPTLAAPQFGKPGDAVGHRVVGCGEVRCRSRQLLIRLRHASCHESVEGERDVVAQHRRHLPVGEISGLPPGLLCVREGKSRR